MRSLLRSSPSETFIIILLLSLLMGSLPHHLPCSRGGSKLSTTVEALTEPPVWVARMDDDWPAGCSATAFQIATVFPDGKGNVYGSFESCHKIFKRDLSAAPGVWTHVAGDGTDPTLVNLMSTQATGTNTPVTTGGPWMGLNNDIIYFSGQGGTNWYYTYSMELTSGNYGITVMAGNGGSSGSCTDGNVPTPGALPTSVLGSPSFGVYRVTDGYVYQAVQSCQTIMKLETAFPYQTEIEWIGTKHSISGTNTFGTNDPTALGGGAVKTELVNPASVTLNAAETEMYVPCLTAFVKIVVATRTTSLVVGGNGGIGNAAHSNGIGSAAGFGAGINAYWTKQDETLFIMSFDSSTGSGALVAIDVTTQELRVLPHKVAPPAATGFVNGLLSTSGQVSVPLFLKDPLSPPEEDRYFVFSQFSGQKGTWTIPTRTMTMSESAELPTPAPPSPVPVPATPVPPVPVPPTPAPPVVVTPPPTPSTPSTTTTTVSTASQAQPLSPTTAATSTTILSTSSANPSTTTVTTTAAATTITTTSSVDVTTTTTTEIVFEEQGSPPRAAFQNADGGLNSGEKAGISVGVVLALVVVGGIVAFSLWRFKMSKKQKEGNLDAKQIECGNATDCAHGEEKYLSVSPQEKSLFA